MKRTLPLAGLLLVCGCAATPERLTLAQLQHVEPDLTEVDVSSSLERAMEGYRQFLANTEVNAQTPEALRRLADLKIEKEFGTHVAPQKVAKPNFAATQMPERESTAVDRDAVDSQAASVAASIRARSAAAEDASILATDAGETDDLMAGAVTSPREAIAIYGRILRDHPYYVRNDQVLYQMARAYDELGEIEQAMLIMDRLVSEFPRSRFIDEVHFRQGEFYFVRRKFLDAEDAYGAIISLGKTSEFYELARYKMGWSLYKQELYEDALDHYLALLDFKVEQGYDFDTAGATAVEVEEERRVADTFRVVSLAFSNLGGADTLRDYFAANGHRGYESRVYQNLAEFYVEKLRFNDAAEVYASFVDQNPLHLSAPQFSMRVTEVYAAGGFPQLVVESKKDFARRYGLASAYWQNFAIDEMPDVRDFLKTNLQDLAQHYHALYQDPELLDHQPLNYAEAQQWYKAFIQSFPADDETPSINYRLADLHLEQGAFALAARAYEHTAYAYPEHEQAPAAGYAAVFAHRELLAAAPADKQQEVLRATIASSLKFADTFPAHEEAAPVLGRAADDLYGLRDYEEAITAGQQLVEVHADADITLRRRAWTVISHSHFDLARYDAAEVSYLQVLELLDEDTEEGTEITEALAASIYQQGTIARDSGDHAAAAEHFLRVKHLAPAASLRPEAEYDAAASLVSLAAWGDAARVLNDFRSTHEGHELQGEVTKQLALVYREAGRHSSAAQEYRRVADAADNADQRSEALLLAAELFVQAGETDAALQAYRDFVNEFSEPFELNIETRQTIAKLVKPHGRDAYFNELQTIVALDADAGERRTDRTRYLAAHAALELSAPAFEHFADMKLVLPFEESLREKQSRMDSAMAVMEGLVAYEVADVTAAATFYIAEIYRNFSAALMASQRPEGLSEIELAEYDMVLEEEAYPFEERAIEVHEANLELLRGGAHNTWVEHSLQALSALNPARYDKQMASAGYMRAIDTYAYRSPLADTMVAEIRQATELPDQASIDAAQVLTSGGRFDSAD
jgi:tetratricopeptide (TPR) repeat protein